MLAVIGLEELRPRHISEPLRPWVARLTGRDAKYKYAREFLAFRRDYRDASKGGRRGVMLYFELRPGIYEVNRIVSPSKEQRYFVRSAAGSTEEISEDAVEISLSQIQLAPSKRPIGIDVLSAAKQRIWWTFETFPHVYLSGPSGKDSGAMMHLVCQEARRRGRKVGVLYLDLEAQYRVTIEHVREMFSLYADCIEPHWLAIPIHLRNAVSMREPYWIAWDPKRRDAWVREPPPEAMTDWARFDWYRPPWTDKITGRRAAMEFEEIVAAFGHWYGRGEATACLVGIRSDESLNRWRAIVQNRKSRFEGRGWTSWKGRATYNVYPIYDWKTEDIWTFFGRTGLPYNRLYDLMYQAGVPISQQRICQPFGDDQRRGLSLYHVIEPETWSRVVARVEGANQGALYCGKRGNILGNGKISKPDGHTWESYATFLLDSLPEAEREHYKDKIAVFIRWWREKKGIAMVDEADAKLEAARKVPSWRRVCKVILKNDRLCKGLSFSQQTSDPTAYDRYKKIMKTRRLEWGIFNG